VAVPPHGRAKTNSNKKQRRRPEVGQAEEADDTAEQRSHWASLCFSASYPNIEELDTEYGSVDPTILVNGDALPAVVIVDEEAPRSSVPAAGGVGQPKDVVAGVTNYGAA
jgi:hypothetical protein